MLAEACKASEVAMEGLILDFTDRKPSSYLVDEYFYLPIAHNKMVDPEAG